MSVLPILIDYDPWGYYPSRPTPSPWDHYGVDVAPSEMQWLSAIPLMLAANSRNQMAANRKGDLQKPQPVVGKDGFQVHMDVQQFKPNEISVKTIDDFIVVEAKHEEKQDDHGCIARHFVRKYKLPKGYDANQVASTLSSDGVLTIKAPPPPSKSVEGNERIVQIQQTGPAHLNVKENKTEEMVQNGDQAEK